MEQCWYYIGWRITLNYKINQWRSHNSFHLYLFSHSNRQTNILRWNNIYSESHQHNSRGGMEFLWTSMKQSGVAGREQPEGRQGRFSCSLWSPWRVPNQGVDGPWRHLYFLLSPPTCVPCSCGCGGCLISASGLQDMEPNYGNLHFGSNTQRKGRGVSSVSILLRAAHPSLWGGS